VSGFSKDWLALREPADRAARDSELLKEAAGTVGADATIVDLGSGTGAMMRVLSPLLPAGQSWRLVDNDRQLLAACTAPAGLALARHAMDLGAIEDLPFADADLVTATALIDLVSEAWLARVVARLAEARLPFYACLTYDGLAEWTPRHARDGDMAASLNAHQRTDKGFGPALGPDAADRLADLLAPYGYRVRRAKSPWRLDAAQAALQIATTEGFAASGLALGTCSSEVAADWLAFRRGAALAGSMIVGHDDLLALPG
jgi:hypothetical protein